MGWSEWQMGLFSDGARQPLPKLKLDLPTFDEVKQQMDSAIMRVADAMREEIREAEADLIRAAIERGLATGRGVMVAHGMYQFEDGPERCKVTQRVAAWPSRSVPVGEIHAMTGIIDWLVVEGLIEESRGG